MKTVTEHLKLRKVVYPQINRLPNKTYFIKQSRTRQYAGFLKSKRLISPSLGKSLKEARQNALYILNSLLRDKALIYNKPTDKDYLSILR
jgi:hypothetical protein